MNNNPVPCMNDIIVWPDGTDCYRDELSEMTHMSDDYTVLFYDTSGYWKHFNKVQA